MSEEEWHFVMTVPVWNTQRDLIEGTLFTSYRIDRLKPTIAAFDHTYGSTSLVQVFDGVEPRIIFTVGDIAPQMKKEELMRIGKSHWYILFTAAPEFYKNTGMNPAVLVGILGAL